MTPPDRPDRVPEAGPARPVAAWAVPLCVAFAARVAAGLLLPAGDRGPRGFEFYGTMADNLLAGRGLCWDFYESLGCKYANRAPLYPLLVAGVRSLAGTPGHAALVVVQALVGAAGVAAGALLAARWAGHGAAVLALWLGALWPYSVSQDAALMEHVLFAPLSVLSVWATARALDAGRRGDARSLLAGGVAAAAVLARLTFSLAVPLLALVALRRRGLRCALLLAVGVAVGLTPWVARNWAVVGRPVLGTDTGRALWIGTSPTTFEHYPAESIDVGEIASLRTLAAPTIRDLRALAADELEQDDRFRTMAVAEIAADPAGAAWRGVRKAAALWSPVYNPGPTSPLKSLVFAATLVPMLAAAACGAAACARLRADLPVVLAVAGAFTASAAIFWGQSRYLAALHGIGIAMAAAWLARRPERAT